VHDGSAEFVARVGRSLADQDDLPTGGWSTEAMAELLDRLDIEAWVQAMAIREAAKGGGYISRDIVYALGGCDPERQQGLHQANQADHSRIPRPLGDSRRGR
jgi:hypothetical protein